MLINESTEKNKLKTPAKTSDNMFGCTDSVKDYYNEKYKKKGIICGTMVWDNDVNQDNHCNENKRKPFLYKLMEKLDNNEKIYIEINIQSYFELDNIFGENFMSIVDDSIDEIYKHK